MRFQGMAAAGLLLGAGVVGTAQEAGPPPLTPPAEAPSEAASVPAPAPATAAPAAGPAEPGPPPLAPEERPLLVVPGLPTPRTRPSSVGIDLPSLQPIDVPISPVEAEPEGPPPLVGPAELGGVGAPAPRFLPDLPGGGGPSSLTLEPGTSELERRLGPLPGDLERPVRPEGREASRKPSAAPPPAPRRRLFGIIPLATPTTPVPPPPDRDDDKLDELGDPDKVAARLADRALERKLEDQVRNAVGSRVRSLDVRVAGRKVYVEARPSRFWYKRGVKKTLEGLPALAGYQTRIEVLD